ncbi:MAG: PEP-CTERM sorting domain-containing protein [Verrucomicrobiota bacterium]
MKLHRSIILASGLAVVASTASAATIVSYLDNAFTSGNITNSNDSLAYSSADLNVAASALTKSIANDTLSAFSTATGTFFARADNVPDSGGSAWVTFNVSVAEGYSLDLASLTFDFGGSNSGGSPASYTANSAVYYSLDNFATAGTLVGSTSNTDPLTLASGNVINLGYNANLDLSSISGLSSGETIAFRVTFTDNSTSTNISLRVDNIALTGTTASNIPEPSSLAVIAGAFTLGLVVVRRRRA